MTIEDLDLHTLDGTLDVATIFQTTWVTGDGRLPMAYFGFTADGTNDVVLRFAPLTPEGEAVHQAFFVLDGFELDQVPEPSGALLALCGLAVALRRRGLHRRARGAPPSPAT